MFTEIGPRRQDEYSSGSPCKSWEKTEKIMLNTNTTILCHVSCTPIFLCALYTGLLYPWYVIIIPMYNAHPYFSLRNVGKNMQIIHGKIQYLFTGWGVCSVGSRNYSSHEYLQIASSMGNWGKGGLTPTFRSVIFHVSSLLCLSLAIFSEPIPFAPPLLPGSRLW